MLGVTQLSDIDEHQSYTVPTTSVTNNIDDVHITMRKLTRPNDTPMTPGMMSLSIQIAFLISCVETLVGGVELLLI